MERTFPMEGGQVRCRETAGRAEVVMEITPPDRGLYRGYLFGPGGKVDLGTLMPEGGRLRLRRSFSVEQLKERGCWPVLGGQAELSYAFRLSNGPKGWTETGDLGQLFLADPVLARAGMETGKGYFCRRPAGEFCLAFPWAPERPFPLPPVFCFSEVKTLGGKPHVVFQFRVDGSPVPP